MQSRSEKSTLKKIKQTSILLLTIPLDAKIPVRIDTFTHP